MFFLSLSWHEIKIAMWEKVLVMFSTIKWLSPNNGFRRQNLLRCDHWVQVGPLNPKLLGFMIWSRLAFHHSQRSWLLSARLQYVGQCQTHQTSWESVTFQRANGKKHKLCEFKKISTPIVTYNQTIVPLVCTRWPSVLCPKGTIDNCSLQNQRLNKCNIIEDLKSYVSRVKDFELFSMNGSSHKHLGVDSKKVLIGLRKWVFEFILRPI